MLIARGQFTAAASCFAEALLLNPWFPQAHAHLGYAMDQAGDTHLAEQHYRKALLQLPAMPHVHLNLGALLVQQKRLAEAEASYAAALALDPSNAQIWSNLGSLNLALKRDDDAETCLRHAMALDPQADKPRFNLAYLQLQRGNFAEGWTLFEARDWYQRMEQHFKFPRWQGEPLTNRRLVLSFEAGHGDVIQFCRYARRFRERGASHVALICHPALTRLLQSVSGIDEVISFDDAVPQTGYDFWTPLLSAPYHFNQQPDLQGAFDHQGAPGLADGIDSAIPYISANPQLIARWKPHLSALPAMPALPTSESRPIHPLRPVRIGLVWRGNPRFENDRDRSLPDLALLSPLWQVPDTCFISLQKGGGEDQARALSRQLPLLCLGEQLDDFADAAAVLAQLDLLISVDTAMAHLAGAMGVACWLLLPHYMTDWRWGKEATQSRWYPNALRLFRQDASERWEGVIEQLQQALRGNTEKLRRATVASPDA